MGDITDYFKPSTVKSQGEDKENDSLPNFTTPHASPFDNANDQMPLQSAAVPADPQFRSHGAVE
jgi:hypothetical protein